jgi:Fe-S cluster biogenesis protein NfuA
MFNLPHLIWVASTPGGQVAILDTERNSYQGVVSIVFGTCHSCLFIFTSVLSIHSYLMHLPHLVLFESVGRWI